MIRVSRAKTDSGGNQIGPGAKWEQIAAQESRKAIAERPQHSPNRHVYGAREVRQALWILFIEKCAYCETKLTRTAMDVDHYRPKARVHESNQPYGYYWLAYIWGNLYPSCSFCNRRRRENPWESESSAPTGGKGDRFPLVCEADRAISPSDNVSNEAPLLLDPCVDDPAEYFGYLPDGQIYALGGSLRAEKSIWLYNLELFALRRARRVVFAAVDVLRDIERKLEIAGQKSLANQISAMIASHLADESEYAGVARFAASQT